MNQSTLLAFPSTPPTSPNDPDVALPACLVRIHASMLAFMGVEEDQFGTWSELVRCNLMVQHYEPVSDARIYSSEPFSSDVMKPGRQEFIAALRDFDGRAIYPAYRQCVEYDGLPEIERAWQATIRSYGRA